MTRRRELGVVALLFALALALRLVAPEVSPPGFNDDELSNALVISQHVRDGDIRLYYADASGHEALYHILAAPLVPLFGATHVGIRGVSILCGALSVALLYLLVRRLWGQAAALVAALGLAFSFWSLIYSRTGQRHISLTAFALLAFYCWWRGMAVARAPAGAGDAPRAVRYGWFAASGAAVGVGFYTYFASRGVPLILLAFALYLLVFHRTAFLRHWRGFALALVIATALGAPLLVVLSQNPDAEARVAELAAPLYALRGGDPSMLVEYALRTLGMFAFTGDDEALYNIPYRPVFGVVGAVFFGIGVAVALWRWREPAHAFLLLWFAAGLAPGALAVPAASLGHTILAQPAAYIFPALGMVWVGQKATAVKFLRRTGAARALLVLAVIYVGAEAARNLYDYFVVRPQDGFVRVLFHTDFMALARYLNDHPEVADIAIGAQIEERWNQAAFDIALDRDDVRARWYDPRTSRLNLFAEGYLAVPHYFFEDPATQYIPAQYRTVVAQTDAYRLYRMPALAEVAPGEDVAFAPGLTLRHASVHLYPGESVYVGTTWQVRAPLDLPARPLYAKPPAPGEPTTPRLEVFVHVLPPDGETPVHAAGGLGVDPYTLHPTDVFELRLTLPWDALAPGAYRVGVGLFDPWTGARYATEDGREMVIVGALEVPE